MNLQNRIEFTVNAPGKVILFGEHSVVYGKTALAASLNLRTTLSFTDDVQLKTQHIIVNLPDINLYYEFFIQDLYYLLLDNPLPLLSNAPQSVFSLDYPEIINLDALLEKVKSFISLKQKDKMLLNSEQESALCSFLCLLVGMLSSVNIRLHGCSFKVTSQLSIGSGMGSSTAYNVCVAAAFLHLIRKKMCYNTSHTNISKKGFKNFKFWSTNLSVFEDRETNLISRWGQFGDRIMHGNPSGIDTAVCTYGSIIEFRKTEHAPEIKRLPNPQILEILLVNTKVTRNTKSLVALVATKKDQYASIVEPLLQSMDCIALTAAEILRRLNQLYCHHQEDNLKVPEKAIRKEIAKLEDLIDMNQKLLEALGVSHETIDHICRIAKREDLHAKLTGAGGGGYVFVNIPFKGKEKELNAVKISFERHDFPAQQVVLGGPGVTLIDHCSHPEIKCQEGSEIKITESSP